MKVFGTKYQKGSVVLQTVDVSNPIVGEVIKIFIADQRIVLFMVEQLRIIHYVKHLNAYQVVNTGQTKYIAQDKLLDYHPLGKHNGFGENLSKYFVVLHHRVDCMQNW